VPHCTIEPVLIVLYSADHQGIGAQRKHTRITGTGIARHRQGGTSAAKLSEFASTAESTVKVSHSYWVVCPLLGGHNSVAIRICVTFRSFASPELAVVCYITCRMTGTQSSVAIWLAFALFISAASPADAQPSEAQALAYAAAKFNLGIGNAATISTVEGNETSLVANVFEEQVRYCLSCRRPRDQVL
jgi:hypothetical protein